MKTLKGITFAAMLALSLFASTGGALAKDIKGRETAWTDAPPLPESLGVTWEESLPPLPDPVGVTWEESLPPLPEPVGVTWEEELPPLTPIGVTWEE